MHPEPTFLYIGTYAADDDYPWHRHPGIWELVYYTRGRAKVLVGDREFEGAPGVLVATPPDTPHAEVALPRYANIHLTVRVSGDPGWPVVVQDGPGGRIRHVLEAALEERADPEGEMVALLMRELDLLLRRAATDRTLDRTAELVARGEEIMERELADGPSLAALARRLGVSSSTLRLAFLRERGATPRVRLAEIRLRAALAELRTSTSTHETIARVTGYASASHLSRHVMQVFGIRPGELRRRVSPETGLPSPLGPPERRGRDLEAPEKRA